MVVIRPRRVRRVAVKTSLVVGGFVGGFTFFGAQVLGEIRVGGLGGNLGGYLGGFFELRDFSRVSE